MSFIHEVIVQAVLEMLSLLVYKGSLASCLSCLDFNIVCTPSGRVREHQRRASYSWQQAFGPNWQGMPNWFVSMNPVLISCSASQTWQHSGLVRPFILPKSWSSKQWYTEHSDFQWAIALTAMIQALLCRMWGRHRAFLAMPSPS